MELISSKELKKEHLPRKMARWERIVRFASSFDIQKELPDGIEIKSIFDVSQNSSVNELRSALYVEWRRFNHFHQDPDSDTTKQIWQAIEWIRKKI